MELPALSYELTRDALYRVSGENDVHALYWVSEQTAGRIAPRATCMEGPGSLEN